MYTSHGGSGIVKRTRHIINMVHFRNDKIIMIIYTRYTITATVREVTTVMV